MAGPNFYDGKNVLVAGGAGFIGSHVAERLLALGAQVCVATHDKSSKKFVTNLGSLAKKIKVFELDLKSAKDCGKCARGQGIIINLASSIGNMEFNRSHADILRENILIELNMLEAARMCGAQRYLLMSSAFVYPEGLAQPVKEEDSARGEIGESKFGYGWSKKANEAAARAYAKQYGLRIAIIRPSNVYGPRDNFFSGRGLVIPSFIEKAFSPAGEIVVSGDGDQVRNFIYVQDCVEGMLLCLEKHAKADPVNIATRERTTINALAGKITKESGRQIKVRNDPSLPVGPKVMVPDCSKAEKLLGFRAKTGIDEGLAKTISWYRKTAGL